jgi:Fe-S-cluster containining protein
MMQFVPWQHIANWQCKACGDCCKLYSVVLNFPEWLNITQTFGAQTTTSGNNKLFLNKTQDGSCVFLCHYAGTYLCGLQNMKPDACKLWPFRILAEPKYGDPKQAVFEYSGKKLFIYADSHCAGLRYGSPTWEFKTLILKEFSGLALGTCRAQHNTTRNSVPYGLKRYSLY